MDARLGLATLLVGAGLLAACSSRASDTANDDPIQAVPAGDPVYALSQLRHSEAESELTPTNLENALPNHRLKVRGTGHLATFSDALVVGTVTNVVKGRGVIWRDDDDFTVVGYDDADADTRTAYVTTRVDDVVGAIDAHARTVTFRVLVPFAANPQEFIEGLAGLGRIAVVLDHDPNRAEAVPWRPILNDSLIGVVADDGSLTLPALRRGSAFAGDIHTGAQLLAAARRPATTTTITLP